MKEKYTEGLDMEQFKHIEEISYYNNNYYIGFDNDLLFRESEDDSFCTWYLVKHCHFYELGISYIEKDNKLEI